MLHLQADMNITVQLEGDMNAVSNLDGELDAVNQIDGDMQAVNRMSGDMEVTSPMDGELAVIQEASTHGSYTGRTEVTPTTETQVLRTAGYSMNSDITINPIPQNYGLITWNGSTLMVS